MSSLHSKSAASPALKANVASVLFVRAAGPVFTRATGAVVSTVHSYDAASLTLPAPSVARTSNVCAPSASGGSPGPAPYDCELVHATHSPASSLHSNVACSSASNPRLAAVRFVSRSGPDPIDATGATVSTVQPYDAASPKLPAPSVARTRNTWSPSANGAAPGPTPYSCGLVHATHSPASSLHSNVACSSAPKPRLASVRFVNGSGPDPIDATGATVSTVQRWDAASPKLPAPSVARTRNTCSPSASGGSPGPDPYTCGLAHATQSPSSSLHSKLNGGSGGPWSMAPKSKLAAVRFVRRSGPEPIDATGATVSTVHSYDAASPTLPAPSVARTANACPPSASAARPSRPYSCGLEHASQSPASSRHSNLSGGSAGPASVALNAKLAAMRFVNASGPLSTRATGATVSTVHS